MKKKEISFPPPSESHSAQTCFCWGGWKMSKFEISNGHNWGVIWSYRPVSTTPETARTSSCSGEVSQGAWGLGLWENVVNVIFVGPFVFDILGFFFFWRNAKKRNLTKFSKFSCMVSALVQTACTKVRRAVCCKHLLQSALVADITTDFFYLRKLWSMRKDGSLYNFCTTMYLMNCYINYPQQHIILKHSHTIEKSDYCILPYDRKMCLRSYQLFLFSLNYF